MKWPFIDRIWRVRNSLALEAPVSPADAFERLDPLFQTHGTRVEIEGDTLTFDKHNPAAQDKLATFTRGTLRVVESEGRSRLTYDLSSPALLFCFLAPLLFLAFAQITIAIGNHETAAAEASPEEEDGSEEEDKEVQLHPIDVFLGAPAPEKPDEKDDEKDEDKDDKHSPKTAYILAAIFAALYVAGRILEPWLIKSTFRKTLTNNPVLDDAQTGEQAGEQATAQPPG